MADVCQFLSKIENYCLYFDMLYSLCLVLSQNLHFLKYIISCLNIDFLKIFFLTARFHHDRQWRPYFLLAGRILIKVSASSNQAGRKLSSQAWPFPRGPLAEGFARRDA